jgi:hypothetical protein
MSRVVRVPETQFCCLLLLFLFHIMLEYRVLTCLLERLISGVVQWVMLMFYMSSMRREKVENSPEDGDFVVLARLRDSHLSLAWPDMNTLSAAKTLLD